MERTPALAKAQKKYADKLKSMPQIKAYRLHEEDKKKLKEIQLDLQAESGVPLNQTEVFIELIRRY